MTAYDLLHNGVHYGLHFVFPGLLAYVFFRKQWKKAWLIMIATMLIDIDHLFATPFYDPGRCSVGFHYLHTYYAFAFYILLLFFKKYRIIAAGLVFHIITDFQDCYWM